MGSPIFGNSPVFNASLGALQVEILENSFGTRFSSPCRIPQTLNPLQPKPYALSPKPLTQTLNPYTLNPKPNTPQIRPQTSRKRAAAKLAASKAGDCIDSASAGSGLGRRVWGLVLRALGFGSVEFEVTQGFHQTAL